MNFWKKLSGGGSNPKPAVSVTSQQRSATPKAEPASPPATLTAAIRSGDADRVNALIAAGADVTSNDGITALLEAAAKGHLDCLKALLSASADVNAKDKTDGTTALFVDRALLVAAANGHLGCVEALIAAGADVNAKDKSQDGITPLVVAAAKGHSDCVEALIAAGADVNAKEDTRDTTALMCAASKAFKGSPDCVKALIAAGAEVNSKNMDGTTALMFAAHACVSDSLKALDCVKLLIAAGADVNATSHDGVTALKLATNKQREIENERREIENEQSAFERELRNALNRDIEFWKLSSSLRPISDYDQASYNEADLLRRQGSLRIRGEMIIESLIEIERMVAILREAGAAEFVQKPSSELKSQASQIPTLYCSGCGKTYRIGDDAVAVAVEYAYGLVSRAMVLSDGVAPDREDLVDSYDSLSGPPEELESSREKARQNWKIIQDSLAKGQSRNWRCRTCDKVNSYKTKQS